MSPLKWIKIRPLMPRYIVPLTSKIFFNADPSLIARALAATDDLFSSLARKISIVDLEKFAITAPKSIIGTIATGDQFIHDSQHIAKIMIEKPETVAVEMEGAAVAQVCNDYNIPFVVIRTISDKADHNSKINFLEFIEKIAKHYSEHIILNICNRM